MSQIDKQRALEWLRENQADWSIISEFQSGALDAHIDYQQRYEDLVQAIHDYPGDMISARATSLISWMESVCPHFDDAFNRLEDDSND